MSTKDTGGPAFPCDVTANKVHIVSDGMTLRDYFAGQWLAGYVANPNGAYKDADAAAKAAYLTADAFLKARTA